MDFKQIQELIKLINKSNIGEVTIEEKGFKITVKQKEEHIQQVFSAPFQNQSAPTYTAPVVSAPHARHEIRHRMPALATLNRVEMPIRLAVLFEGPRPVPVVSSAALICDLAVKQ